MYLAGIGAAALAVPDPWFTTLVWGALALVFGEGNATAWTWPRRRTLLVWTGWVGTLLALDAATSADGTDALLMAIVGVVPYARGWCDPAAARRSPAGPGPGTHAH